MNKYLSLFVLFLYAISVLHMHTAMAFGVNLGSLASHRLPDKAILHMFQTANITKVKLFDADPKLVQVFASTNIEVMIGAPNYLLASLADPNFATDWVKTNVIPHLSDVNIRFVAVGNEPFLKAYNGTFDSLLLPALKSMKSALDALQHNPPIKVVAPLNADILTYAPGAYVPSGGIFRPDIQSIMMSLATFFDQQGSPFLVNIYPFLNMYLDPNFPKEFAFFDQTSVPALQDSGRTYTNVFDATYDLLVAALTRNGFPNMSIVVGEVGWPTDGDISANAANAKRFNEGLLQHISSGKGTPLRPNQEIDVYLFSLTDEDQKSTLPGTFEKHWGLFTYDGKLKYTLTANGLGIDLTSYANYPVTYLPQKWCVLNPNADMSNLGGNMEYACLYGDCTELVYGASCNNLGSVQGNASYAFNNYYQMHNQDPSACYFQGLAMITNVDPSVGECKFSIQMDPASAS